MLESKFDIWKYLEFSKVKHLFYTEKSTRPVCPIQSLDYIPNQWKNDEKELRKRRPCKRCIDIRDS